MWMMPLHKHVNQKSVYDDDVDDDDGAQKMPNSVEYYVQANIVESRPSDLWWARVIAP